MGAKLTKLSALYHGVEPPLLSGCGMCSLEGSRMTQEDAPLAFVSPSVSWALFGVFDGHGGIEMAQRASDYFPLYIWRRTQGLRPRPSAALLKEALNASFKDVEENLLEEAKAQGGVWREQGTCAVVCALTAKDLVVGNLGDSRAVLCDKEGRAVCVTQDHKVGTPAEAERLEARGGILDESRVHVRLPGAPDVGIGVSRALGDPRFKKVPALELEDLVSPIPDIFHSRLSATFGSGPFALEDSSDDEAPELPEFDEDAELPRNLMTEAHIEMPESPEGSPEGPPQESPEASPEVSHDAKDSEAQKEAHAAQGSVQAQTSPPAEHAETTERGSDTVGSHLQRIGLRLGRLRSDSGGGDSATSDKSPRSVKSAKSHKSVKSGKSTASALASVFQRNRAPSPPPETQLYNFLLLACDGVFDVMTSEEAIALVSGELAQLLRDKEQGAGDRKRRSPTLSTEECGRVCEALGTEALRRGSRDNVTSVLVLFKGFEDLLAR